MEGCSLTPCCSPSHSNNNNNNNNNNNFPLPARTSSHECTYVPGMYLPAQCMYIQLILFQYAEQTLLVTDVTNAYNPGILSHYSLSFAGSTFLHTHTQMIINSLFSKSEGAEQQHCSTYKSNATGKGRHYGQCCPGDHPILPRGVTG